MKKILLLPLFCFFVLSQEIIGEGMTGEILIEYIIDNYSPSTTFNYATARDIMYGNIDNDDGDVSCVYTNFTVENVPNSNLSTQNPRQMRPE